LQFATDVLSSYARRAETCHAVPKFSRNFADKLHAVANRNNNGVTTKCFRRCLTAADYFAKFVRTASQAGLTRR